ncbi:hypothetical protein IID19_02445, partial [Patescibacteria group bacterium]|nr:hypothetical protein [Patescibacteria group bacterium]
MPKRKKKKSMPRRWIMFGALVFFAMQIAIPALVVPRQAQALFGVGDVGITLDNITIEIGKAIDGAIKVASDVAFKNVLRSYLNNLAYNLATDIATGEKGQKPLFIPNPREFLTQAGDAAAGDFLDSIASDWLGKSRCQGFSSIKCDTTVSQCPEVRLRCPDSVNINCSSSVENKNKCLAAGCTIIGCNPTNDNECPEEDVAQDKIEKTGAQFNISFGAPECVSSFSLCEPRDLTVKVQLNILARKAALGEGGDVNISGKCPLTDIIDNFEKGVTEFNPGAGKFYLVEFSKTFNPEYTQLGAYLSILNETKEAEEAEKKAVEFQKLVQKSVINPVTTRVSGLIKTPGIFLQNAFLNLFNQSISQQLVYTGSVVADAVGVFTNTLTSKLIERYVFGGLNPDVDSGGAGRFFSFGGSSPGVTAAKILFADLQQTNYAVTGTTDILSSLSSCPDSTDPTPDTCVIDSRFRTAIEQQMTVREALNQGLLDGTKTFGFDANGLQPSYFNGYPLRSLMILRKYRIIPVGWELAARYIGNYARGNYSITTLINDYNNPNSPFYRLIDPNWVLKSPEVFCSREGAGVKIISSTPVRSEDTNLDNKIDTKDAASFLVQRQGNYCADEQLCLKENEDGSCRKYGYCIEEKPIYKLNGATCDDQYNSCLALQDASGGSASYVLNSVDVNGCNASNAGCQWYCTNYDNTLGDFTCSDTSPALPIDKISFNSQVEQCGVSAEGCNEFIRIKDAGANLLLNGGFENFRTAAFGIYDGIKDSDGAEPDQFSDWSAPGDPSPSPGTGNQLYADTDVFGGFTAARIRSFDSDGSNIDTPIEGGNYIQSDSINTGYLTNQRTFTVSFYAKRDSNDPVNCTGTAGELNLYYMRDQNVQDDYVSVAQVFTSDSWTRYTGSATFPVISDWASAAENEFFLLVRKEATDKCDVMIDNFQIEESSLSTFKIYEDSPKTYLKKAPDYLGCTADQTTNDVSCNNFTLFCSEGEIGCEAFTSVSTGRTITGTITGVGVCDPNVPGSCDQCPSEFVGCQAFRELEIKRSPRRPARDPVSFVSDSGLTCPASAVGCEEYTNLEEVAQGGEGKEYYSFIRMCVPDTDSDIAAYYSWEGSSEFGFQLRQYTLKKSNILEVSGNYAPCTNIGAQGDSILINQLGLGFDWPTCIDGTAVDRDLDGTDDEFYDVASCTLAEVGLNPDCSEFYDTAGNQTYRLKSRIVFADASCKSYRNTIDGPIMTYHLVPGQGTRCSAVYAGCRAYKGNAGDNYREIYVESFENGTVDPWIGNVSYSNESINVSGHSMLVSNSAAIDQAGDSLGFQSNRSYTISFWAKSAVGVDFPITFDFYDSATATQILEFPGSAVARADDWNRYQLGPLYVPIGIDLSDKQLRVYASNAFYIDNINISEVKENIYRVKDSYTECSGYEGCDLYNDRDGSTHYLKSFTKLCREDKVGCEAMIDTQNSYEPGYTQYQLDEAKTYLRGDVNLDGFLNSLDIGFLAKWLLGIGPLPHVYETADVDGDGVVDTTPLALPISCGTPTGNSDFDYYLDAICSIGSYPTGNVTGALNGSIPADEFVFIVNDPAKRCSATQKGCQRLGRPNIDAEGNLQSFNNTYLVNNPDVYGTDLCLFNETSCQEYTSPGGSKYYFKDPGNSTCEFKLVTGQNVAGWYKQGTDTGAPDCPVVSGVCSGGGANDGIACNSSDDCDSGFCGSNSNVVQQPTDGWVGQCPVAVSGCTEYRDPEAVVTSSGAILTANLITNPGFENFVATANPSFATDGVIDTTIPDIFDMWDNGHTMAGKCDSEPGI